MESPRPAPEVFPPRFLYLKVEDDCIAIGIDGYDDRDHLIALSQAQDRRDTIYAWLVAQGDEDVPDRDAIEHIDLEAWDIESDALSGGNDTVEIWNAAATLPEEA